MSTAQSPDTQARIAYLRQKCFDNTATQEEFVEAVKLLRADRLSAASAPKSAAKSGSRAKTAASVPDADSLLADLENFE